MDNRVIYFEIPSSDTEASKKFFDDVFGWTFRPFGEMDYWQAMTGDPKQPGIDGAIMKKVHPEQPLVNSIQVENIDETLEKVEAAGGSIALPKMAIPMVGWLAYIKDPDGYVHGVAQLVPNFDADRHAVKLERIFEAPVERVWAAWTDPEMIKQWWGPKDFTAPAARIDFRVGGRYLYCMRSPEGRDYYSAGTFREIEPYKRISMTDGFSDPAGNLVPASYYEMTEDMPLVMIITVTFEPQGGRTKFTLHHQVVRNEEVKRNTAQFWIDTFDKLEKIL